MLPAQPGPDPFVGQNLDLPLPEMGAAIPALLRVPATIGGMSRRDPFADSEAVALFGGLSSFHPML